MSDHQPRHRHTLRPIRAGEIDLKAVARTLSGEQQLDFVIERLERSLQTWPRRAATVENRK